MTKEGFDKIVQMAFDYVLSHPSIFIILITFFVVGIILLFWKKEKQDFAELPDGNITQHRELPNPEETPDPNESTPLNEENNRSVNRNKPNNQVGPYAEPIQQNGGQSSQDDTYLQPRQLEYPDVTNCVRNKLTQPGPSNLTDEMRRELAQKRMTLAELKQNNRTSEITVTSNNSDLVERSDSIDYAQFERSNSIDYVPMGPKIENIPLRPKLENVPTETKSREQKRESGAYRYLQEVDDFDSFEELEGNIMRLTMNFDGSRENSYLEQVKANQNLLND